MPTEGRDTVSGFRIGPNVLGDPSSHLPSLEEEGVAVCWSEGQKKGWVFSRPPSCSHGQGLDGWLTDCFAATKIRG
jgi:hypothetical protein